MSTARLGEPRRLLALPLRWLASMLGAVLDTLPEPRPVSSPSSDRAPRATGAAAFDREIAAAALGPPTHQTPVPAGPTASPPLPRGAAEDRLVVMVRTPETAFAFWDLTPASLEQMRMGIDGRPARLALRVRVDEERGDGDRPVRVVLLPPGADSLYLTDLPERSLLDVSLGIACRDRFVELASCRTVRTPPRRPRPAAQACWRDHATGRDVPGYDVAIGRVPLPPADLARHLPPARPPSTPLSVVTPAPNPRAVPARR